MKKTMTILMALVSSQAYAANQYIGMGTGDFSMNWNRLTKTSGEYARNNKLEFNINGTYGYKFHPYMSVGLDLGVVYNGLTTYADKTTTTATNIKNTFKIAAGPHMNVFFLGTVEGPLATIGLGIDYTRYSMAINNNTTEISYPTSNIDFYGYVGLGYNLPLAVLNATNVTWSPSIAFRMEYNLTDDGLKAGAGTAAIKTYETNYTLGVVAKLINFNLFF